ncbi:hypothetical protein DFH09DRAFT_1303178 [Mycena vulgaris]|nr:hypothetical protein DFH09DRAFT_1303178 [Mycena vulgaris]
MPSTLMRLGVLGAHPSSSSSSTPRPHTPRSSPPLSTPAATPASRPRGFDMWWAYVAAAHAIDEYDQIYRDLAHFLAAPRTCALHISLAVADV